MSSQKRARQGADNHLGPIETKLERVGLLVRDIENSYPQLQSMAESVMDDLVGHSVTYPIAIGPLATIALVGKHYAPEGATLRT